MEKELIENGFAKITDNQFGIIYRHGNFILSKNFQYCIEKGNKIIPISQPLADFEDVKILYYLINKRQDIEELYALINKHGG
jgi:hypothetical protein